MKELIISCTVTFVSLVLILLIFGCPFEKAISACWFPAFSFGSLITYLIFEEEEKRKE